MQDFYGIEPPPKETPPTRAHKVVKHLIGNKADALWAWLTKTRAPKALAPLLVNKEYYDDIDAKMARTWRPTVKDAVAYMRQMGNKTYYEHWKYLGEEGRREKFDDTHIGHEISHLAGRFAHTIQGEHFGVAFEAGLTYGISRSIQENASTQARRDIDVNVSRCFRIAEQWQKGPAERAVKRDEAVYFAAGLYLREKMEMFLQTGMLDRPYREQKKFCTDYAHRNHVPLRLTNGKNGGEVMDMLASAPYDLIKLSREEWRAITAVATGLAEPRDTPYPDRLSAIKQALVHVGLFHDMKPVFEKAAENHETNIRSYNAKLEEKNRTTHGESPQKLATIRGVDREMHHAARARRGAPASGTRAL